MSCLTAFISAGEVYLFGFLGNLVDWLAVSDQEVLLNREGGRLLWMGIVLLVVLPAFTLLHSLLVHQTLLGNYPMIARWKMHRSLLKQSMGFFADEFAGRLVTKVMQTSLAVRESVMKLLDVFVYVGVFFISMIVLLGTSDWRLMVPLIAWVVVYGALIKIFVPRLKILSKDQADARSLMTGRVVDSYTNISTVKLFSHAGREAVYAREGMDDFLKTVHKQMRLVTGFQSSVYFINALLVFMVSGTAILLWLNSDISIGSITIAIALCLRINGMSQWIMWEVAGLFEDIGVVYDGISMMTKPHDVNDAPNARQLAIDQGEIIFDNVGFHYGNRREVIDALSLTINPGEKIGVIGRSGSGKTTLMNLLLRFYDLESGCILIDGQDIATVTQDSLRSNIGVVSQDTSLLHRSIRENISYSAPDALDGAIIDAAKNANAWSFIEGLEDAQGGRGLDAHVGERGVKLSGGQRQRIAISRVFLKNSPILLLDEATSALDSEVEAAIQENLFRLMKGKTVIAIAHRLSTIAQLDRLVILDGGEIVESGTHAELVEDSIIYTNLWSRQSGGFLAPDKYEKNIDAA
jgi:ATP-binding cassette subfamily B multidrug efflux pump